MFLFALAAWWHWRNTGPRATILEHQTLPVAGTLQQYRLAMPPVRNDARPAPLVFVFHGSGGNPQGLAADSGLDEWAARDGMYVVYPAARRGIWQFTIGDGQDPEENRDLAAFDGLLSHLLAEYPIHPRRVYATGISTGGAFTHLLAIRRGTRLAAVAPHSGWLSDMQSDLPGRKCPVLIVSGALDQHVSIVQAEAARKRYEQIWQPAEIFVVDGLGHAWGGRQVNERIKAFFAERESLVISH